MAGKITEMTELSVPALEDYFETVDDPTGTPLTRRTSATRMFGAGVFLCQGRLTLTSGTAVTSSDVTAASTLYFTPYKGRFITLWDGTRWRQYALTEISLALTLTADKNYDVFIYDNSGTLTLVLSSAWTNDTTRADALGTQDGIPVLNSDKTRLHLGTIRASATDDTEDSVSKRFVWNRYNPEPRPLRRIHGDSTWTYDSTTVRQADGDTANKVEAVYGDTGRPSRLVLLVAATAPTGSGASVGFGVSTTTAFESTQIASRSANAGDGSFTAEATLDHVALGYYAYNWNEVCATATTITFVGANAAPSFTNAGIAGVFHG